MMCQFCRIRQAQAHSPICAYCDLSYDAETKDLLFDLTQPTKEGVAQETTT